MLRVMDSPFSIEEGAALVAVERANGGELAPLPQVLLALDSFTPARSRPSPASFAASAQLLIEFGVVEWVEGHLGLTAEGRKLLRKSGLLNDPRHVAHVTALLQEFDDVDVQVRERAERPPAPTEVDVRRALGDEEAIEETPGGIETPVLGHEVTTYLRGMAVSSHWVPAVLPQDSAEAEEPPPPPEYLGAPAHPILERLFGRGRRGRS
jgi:hypothetical protein